MPPDDDDGYDRETWGVLISIGMLLVIAAFFAAVAVYNELRTPW